jgi:NADPH:quinone reductase-like Zn-dependent oxidoreductase
MQAVVCTAYGPPDVLELRDVKKPSPRSGDVLIKMFATAVTASDVIVRGLKLPLWSPMGFAMRVAIGFSGPRQPILGMVLAGEVESVGTNVTAFHPGDQVFGLDLGLGFGAYAQYKRTPASGTLALKPANLDYAQAAAIPYGGLIAMHYLHKGNVAQARKVLIYGASGAIGSLAVQLARHFGAQVTAICSAANLELVRSLGAENVIDYKTSSTLPAGESYDLVLDAVGTRKDSPLKQECKHALSPNGRFISVDDGSPQVRLEDLLLLKELIESGEVKPVIDRTYPLEQIAEAHGYVDQGHKKGNVVITVSQ